MNKISYDDYQKMLRNLDIADADIAAYSIAVAGSGSAFNVELRPNPELVDMSEDEKDLENAMKIGNGMSRWRRKRKFSKRVKAGEDLPVLVSEGDSWFQFPILIDETIDNLRSRYLIYSVGAAGDTLQNMVYGPRDKGKTEYMQALDKQRDRVQGFLFSAAGNDIIGESMDTGEPVLMELLRDFNGDANDVMGHINMPELGARLAFLREGYAEVIDTIRDDPDFDELPIIVHGYDHVFPYPASPSDPRNPMHAGKDAWLGAPLDERGIKDTALRRSILTFMIDQLYQMLFDLAGDSDATGIWVVDCRGALPDVSDWADEIHGTSAGFARVADRFDAVLKKALRV